MNNELLQFQLILLFSSVITLFYLYDRELNKQKISLLFSICNISIFLIEIRMIGNLRYLTIAAALFLVFRYYSKQPTKAYIPQINILNTKVQECTGKIDQEMEQQPQYLPAIPSIHESNSSMTPKQIRLSNDNINGPQNTTERGQQHMKQDSGMSFLGDNKRSQYSKNYSNGGLPQRQQSSSPNQSNFNVIKFQDDCGEIKFGILKTLKSVNFDQLGKEMEGIYQNDKTFTKFVTNIEKKGGPRMQILYESQQQTHQVFEDNLRGGIQLDYTNNDSIKIEEPKKVTWKKILQTLFFQTVLICNLYISQPWHLVQVILFAFICLRQIFVLSKLKIKELQITLEFRQILIWNSLVVLPLISLFILNLIVQSIALIVTTIAQLISVMITLKYYQACYDIFLYTFIGHSTLFYLKHYLYNNSIKNLIISHSLSSHINIYQISKICRLETETILGCPNDMYIMRKCFGFQLLFSDLKPNQIKMNDVIQKQAYTSNVLYRQRRTVRSLLAMKISPHDLKIEKGKLAREKEQLLFQITTVSIAKSVSSIKYSTKLFLILNVLRYLYLQLLFMKMENPFIEKLRQFNIDHLQYPYKNYQGQQALIYGCRYNRQAGYILKVIEYENEQSIQKELEIYNRMMKELNENENLVAIKSVIHLKDLKKVCILMEECDTNLKAHQKQNQMSKLQSRLIFFQQFLQGYKSLYDHKIIHRDIKPENILISFQQNKLIYKLADFGVSKLCEESSYIQSQIGTQQYAAPELYKIQSLNQGKFDHEKASKIDVYSLGLVLYELQFKKLPFEKLKTQNEFFDTPLKTRLVSQGDINYEEGWFVGLIMQMIQTNPDERVGFKKLYECYDRKLDTLISNFKKLAENLMIQFVQNPQANTFNQKQGENQHRNNSRSPQYPQVKIFNQKQGENQHRNNSRSPVRHYKGQSKTLFINSQYGQSFFEGQKGPHSNQAQFFMENFQQQQCQTDRTYKR